MSHIGPAQEKKNTQIGGTLLDEQLKDEIYVMLYKIIKA